MEVSTPETSIMTSVHSTFPYELRIGVTGHRSASGIIVGEAVGYSEQAAYCANAAVDTALLEEFCRARERLRSGAGSPAPFDPCTPDSLHWSVSTRERTHSSSLLFTASASGIDSRARHVDHVLVIVLSVCSAPSTPSRSNSTRKIAEQSRRMPQSFRQLRQRVLRARACRVARLSNPAQFSRRSML
jgi:hypothetical protein